MAQEQSEVVQKRPLMLNRRTLIAGGGTAVAAVALARSLGHSFAQDATPVADATPVPSSGFEVGGSAKSDANLDVIPPEVADASGNWPTPQGDLKATRAAVGSTISGANVTELAPEWYFSLADRGGFTGTPIVTADTVYIQDMMSNVIALDRATGAVKWETTFNIGSTGPNGVAIGYGIIAATLGNEASVVGLDATTGAELWRTQIGIPPNEGVDMAPLIYDGTVFVSSIPGGQNSFYKRGQVGVLYALDVLTGDKLWGFNTVADNGWNAPALNGGGGLWYPPSVDDDGNIFFGVGNPAPWPSDPEYPNGSNRPGDNLYTDSMVSLDKTTAGVRWYVQAQPHDIVDHDFQITPVLVTASINGTDTKLAIGAGKTGTVIAANADTGEVIWNTAVGRHLNDDLTEIPSGQDTIVLPGTFGGVETSMATANGLLFVPYVDFAATYSDSSTFSTTTVFGLDQSGGGLIALNLADGSVKWEVIYNSIQIGAATVANDVIFTAGLDGNVNGYNLDTGEPVFAWQSPAGINAQLAVAGDTLYVGAGTFPVISAGPDAAAGQATPIPGAPEPILALVALKIGGQNVEIVPPVEVATPVAEGSASLELSFADIRFEPTTLTISADTATAIKMTNVGATAHNFNIDELNIQSGDVNPGDSVTVTITAPAGSYGFYCSLPGHREAGMVGTLTVQ